MDEQVRAAIERDTERWFVRRGLPHFIHGYSATSDIFTRAVGFLGFVLAVEVLIGISGADRWWQGVLAAAAAAGVTLGAIAAINRLRSRATFAPPEDVGVVELALFIVIPALIPLVDGRPGRALTVVAVNLAVLGVVFVVTSYGLVPMTRWAVGQLADQLGNVSNLFVRSLPLLVLITMFMFFNAEMWKITSDLPTAFLVAALGLLVLVGSAFIVARSPREVDTLARFGTWPEVRPFTEGTPVEVVTAAGMESTPDGSGSGPTRARLTRRERVNVGLVFFASQSIQILLVTAALAAFYVVFGALTVVPSTIAQWTGSPALHEVATWSVGGNDLVLSEELLRTSLFVAAIAGLQFTVAALTDTTYRAEFYGEISDGLRRAFAVRAVYLDRIVRPDTAAAES